MEGVVTADLGICPATPLSIHLQQRLVLATQHKVDCREERTVAMNGVGEEGMGRVGRGGKWEGSTH